ncbi:unnamed protein product [Rotaria socialis]|uniref:G-protein coupled receptors family 1 profile domain-containing protein n=1 Tax=Rotaria socialis TaxID=392032 RepID=A0A817RQP0_9BILA|nr:unnamed protein product [Rotaria socialis]CAF4433807.1 unnamed protein product [Rotaria socialis]
MSNSSSLNYTKKIEEINRFIKSFNAKIFFLEIFIVLFGLLGNILVLIVINRRSLKNTSSSVFITYLAIFDISVLLSHGINLARFSETAVFECSLYFFTDLSTFCANWVLVIITIQRCVVVYSPFYAKRLCTVSSARRAIYIFFGLSVIAFPINFSIFYDLKAAFKNNTCRIRKNFGLSHRLYQSLLFYIVPALFLLPNIFTIYALCRRTHKLSEASLKNDRNLDMRISDVNSNKKQRQLTIMLVTISLSFYLFTIPGMIMYLIEIYSLKSRDINKIKLKFILAQLSVIVLQLNNATNFLFYCFAGHRFRQAAVQTYYGYSALSKTFFHHYILRNKEYGYARAYGHPVSHSAQTALTNRSSTSPYYPRSPYKTSLL